MSGKVAYSCHGEIAVLTVENPPVNALSQPVRAGLLAGIARAEGDAGVRAVLLVGAGRCFIAGADIREFGKPLRDPQLPEVCNRIENSPLLVVAALHGVSLGGGLEVALSAHYRIAQPGARVGLPEVHLGLIPGAGGTQRLPRLTGAERAIEVITTGHHLGAEEALGFGILDRIADGDPLDAGLACCRALLAQGAPRRPVAEMPAPAAIDWDAAYEKILKRGRGQIAPATAVRAVQASAELPFAEGLAAERQMFRELMETDQRRGMIHAFFAERAAGNLPELADVAPRRVARVAVIGGGTMGAGIAAACLLAGLHVALVEQGGAAEAARGRVADILAGSVARGKITAETRDRLLSGMDFVTEMQAVAEADLVIEAVFEEMAAKRAVFAEMDRFCRPGAVLATNTSYLDLDEIAAVTGRPGDVIGLHFFSPAHVMKLLEVVVANHTQADVVATGFTLAKRLGKTAVRAGVCEGFIGNRLLRTCRSVAEHMVLEGATPRQVDAALTGFGFAMGPFETSDLAGLDIAHAMRKRSTAHRDPRERVARFPDRLCETGQVGRKAGRGYYLYPERGPNTAALDFIAAERAERGIGQRVFSDAEIVSRYLCAMVNEGARVVQEDIASRPGDVDVVLMLGYGFPRHWGGPMKWADINGLAEVLERIEGYAREDGFFWQPAPLLRELAEKGGSFDDLNAGA
jgi:3-hydroxyacyl-CoA dehydrogenase